MRVLDHKETQNDHGQKMFLYLFFFFFFDLQVFQCACLLQQSNTSTHFAEIIQ